MMSSQSVVGTDAMKYNGQHLYADRTVRLGRMHPASSPPPIKRYECKDKKSPLEAPTSRDENVIVL